MVAAPKKAEALVDGAAAAAAVLVAVPVDALAAAASAPLAAALAADFADFFPPVACLNAFGGTNPTAFFAVAAARSPAAAALLLQIHRS